MKPPSGRIQRMVWWAFACSPGQALTTTQLARWAYPRLLGAIEHNHRGALRRRCAGGRCACWAIGEGQGPADTVATEGGLIAAGIGGPSRWRT